VRVLLVEDERPLAHALRRTLEDEGFHVTVASDGVEGSRLARDGEADVVVLDVMLPGLSGYDVCRAVRAAGREMPILFLTAKDGEHDEAEALDLGADDFLAKPVSPVVLVAHVRALLRRGRQVARPVQAVGELRLDPSRRQAWLRGVELALTPRELDVLSYLAARPGSVVGKPELLRQVWGVGFEADENVVEVYIGHLRRKLASARGLTIDTVRGLGYRLRAGSR